MPDAENAKKRRSTPRVKLGQVKIRSRSNNKFLSWRELDEEEEDRVKRGCRRPGSKGNSYLCRRKAFRWATMKQRSSCQSLSFAGERNSLVDGPPRILAQRIIILDGTLIRDQATWIRSFPLFPSCFALPVSGSVYELPGGVGGVRVPRIRNSFPAAGTSWPLVNGG